MRWRLWNARWTRRFPRGLKKDEQGKAVLVDGKPVREFGPEDHLPKDVLETDAKKRNPPYFEPLRHDR
ncbi:MAG: hypothetical protein JNM69_03845 [Archangium sp.]|nr:hypothetical protein [Archangium sp.]